MAAKEEENPLDFLSIIIRAIFVTLLIGFPLMLLVYFSLTHDLTSASVIISGMACYVWACIVFAVNYMLMMGIFSKDIKEV